MNVSTDRVVIAPTFTRPLVTVHPKPTVKSTDASINSLERLRATCSLTSPLRRRLQRRQQDRTQRPLRRPFHHPLQRPRQHPRQGPRGPVQPPRRRPDRRHWLRLRLPGQVQALLPLPPHRPRLLPPPPRRQGRLRGLPLEQPLRLPRGLPQTAAELLLVRQPLPPQQLGPQQRKLTSSASTCGKSSPATRDSTSTTTSWSATRTSSCRPG